MTKEDVLDQLSSAKNGHLKWLDRAKEIIRGASLKEDSNPIDSNECKFGKWFYTEGQILTNLSNNPIECMNKMEKLHQELHDIYLNIFTIYFPQEKSKGLLSKIFSSKEKKVSEEETELAQGYLNKMEIVSKDLIDEISRLERRLTAVSDEKIAALA